MEETEEKRCEIISATHPPPRREPENNNTQQEDKKNSGRKKKKRRREREKNKGGPTLDTPGHLITHNADGVRREVRRPPVVGAGVIRDGVEAGDERPELVCRRRRRRAGVDPLMVVVIVVGGGRRHRSRDCVRHNAYMCMCVWTCAYMFY